MEQSARGGEGRGEGLALARVWGRAGVLSWTGLTQAETSLSCWWRVPPHHASLLDTRAGTRSCLFSGCVNLRVQVHIDS